MSAKSLTSRAILGRLQMMLEQSAANWATLLALGVDSDQLQEEHRWLGMSPVMREWIGGRHIHGLRDYGQLIKNIDYEATLEVTRDEIRLDKTRQVMLRVDDLAARTNSFTAKLLSTLIEDLESTVCYDGQLFFDTDHTEGESGTQSNDITFDAVSTTAPTAAEMVTAILNSIQAMYGFKDDRGEPLNEGASNFLVMVPTPFWAAAATAVSVNNLTSGATNPLANMPAISVSVVPNPRLTWTTKFATFRADPQASVKPFIRQEVYPLNVSQRGEGSDDEFYNRRWVFGVDWKGGVGPGFWQGAVLTTLT